MKKIISFSLVTITLLLTYKSLLAIPQNANGKDIYERKCVRCHGEDGMPKKKGVPNLKKMDLTDTESINIITNGEDKMPAFGKKLSSSEIKAVAIYIKGFKK